MSGIDSAKLVMVVIMRMITFFETPHLFATPGSPQHPERDGDDDRGGRELEIGFSRFSIQVLAQIHAAHGHQPDHRGVRNGCRQPQQYRLLHGAADGYDEGRHHGLRVAWLQAMQCP